VSHRRSLSLSLCVWSPCHQTSTFEFFLFSYTPHPPNSPLSLSPSRLHRRLDTCVTLLRSSTHH
ncbi:hypothetical protein CCUS01_05727, partial [Colletotrichum cuscutae]